MSNRMKEFKVNKYITLKLEGEKRKTTNIYVNGKLFRQCRYLLLDIPINNINNFEEIESIDDVADFLDNSLEPEFDLHHKLYYKDRIPPDVEFWGHCSNLQVWNEYDYDTRILHSNLAFPLLKKLAEVGDIKADKVFREEIALRIKNGSKDTIRFLINNKFQNYLSKEELFESLLDDINFYALKEIEHYQEFDWVFGQFKRPQDIYPNVGIQNKKIVELSLNNMGLSKIPSSIRNLKSLTGLHISENCLTEIPKWVYKLTALQFLDLSYNRLMSLPRGIQNLKSLQKLWLGYNEITSLPDLMNDLRELDFIDLIHNKLSNLEMEKIKQMKKENKKIKILF